MGHLKVHDLNLFRAGLIRRWCSTLAGAIREVDPAHPTTAEFYQMPHQGVDLPAASDGLDLANFGYFDRPGADTARFPAVCKYNDLRAEGKSTGPGEYGVKTHPAWGDGQDYGYHTARTRSQALELFQAVAHYALGLGASRIHNWCWKDDAHRVFPWGMVYPGDSVPKDLCYVHRNQSLLFRHLAPVYVEPSVYVLAPDSHRLGGGKWEVMEGILRGIDLALATRSGDLGMLREPGLAIPRAAKVIFYPLPFCPSDQTYAKVLRWVQQGGVLYLSGDISFDERRQRNRTARLEQLCGVSFLRENYASLNVGTNQAADLPCIQVALRGGQARRWAPDGSPLVVEHRVGAGRVFYCADPLELHPAPGRQPRDLRLYLDVLAAAGVQPLQVEPTDSRLHVFRLPLQDGGRAYVLFNTDPTQTVQSVCVRDCEPAVTLRLARSRPGLLWLDRAGHLRAVEAQGGCQVADQTLFVDETESIVLALDGRDLRATRALLLMPMKQGTVCLKPWIPWRRPVVEVGEIAGGEWRRYETCPVRRDAEEWRLEVTADQVYGLLLVTEEGAAAPWREAIAATMTGW